MARYVREGPTAQRWTNAGTSQTNNIAVKCVVEVESDEHAYMGAEGGFKTQRHVRNARKRKSVVKDYGMGN